MSVNLEVVQEVSEFNGYYTGLVELLNRHISESNISLSALRVLVRVGQEDECTAGKLVETLGIDGGYLSRMLKSFEGNHLVSKRKSTLDARTSFLQLTAKGKKLLEMLEERSTAQIQELLAPLPDEQQKTLAVAMKTIRHILSEDSTLSAEDITFRRQLQPGDVGYLIYLHGALYAKESGYNLEFETYVCKTFFEFLEAYNTSKDQIFLASHGSQIVGSVAVLGHSRYIAQLRWFLVHPDFRGLGLGKRLLQDALAFCREKGYQKVYLMTTDKQVTAIDIYKKIGFRKTGDKQMNMWGQHLYEERYDMDL
ncbi:transcriptional regulator, MarR family with acetyltransferase activity [Chitinophaga sp. CF118]|uniref:bifunctional helix-turn-helix transcriptional regulator/GNAT family N-acetyltransferase n=1 Tax=Chitinophaga sp. CF118 TaxID=1884367 RepID=UPI0008E5CE42|nr:helix-turn-helix domain-containing GNAT family N-acetyltransferase [Chitinophaga sp. CF118]SFE90662.1 transcriptional regulator, MarR family with acetyltransferase activity [Chitinophaga sp. CF118]